MCLHPLCFSEALIETLPKHPHFFYGIRRNGSEDNRCRCVCSMGGGGAGGNRLEAKRDVNGLRLFVPGRVPIHLFDTQREAGALPAGTEPTRSGGCNRHGLSLAADGAARRAVVGPGCRRGYGRAERSGPGPAGPAPPFAGRLSSWPIPAGSRADFRVPVTDSDALPNPNHRIERLQTVAVSAAAPSRPRKRSRARRAQIWSGPRRPEPKAPPAAGRVTGCSPGPVQAVRVQRLCLPPVRDMRWLSLTVAAVHRVRLCGLGVARPSAIPTSPRLGVDGGRSRETAAGAGRQRPALPAGATRSRRRPEPGDSGRRYRPERLGADGGRSEPAGKWGPP